MNKMIIIKERFLRSLVYLKFTTIENELSLTIAFSLLFLLIYAKTGFVAPVDIAISPWIIWIGKKLLDNIRQYKDGDKYLDKKFKRDSVILKKNIAFKKKFKSNYIRVALKLR